jgi:hypothetical protein
MHTSAAEKFYSLILKSCWEPLSDRTVMWNPIYSLLQLRLWEKWYCPFVHYWKWVKNNQFVGSSLHNGNHNSFSFFIRLHFRFFLKFKLKNALFYITQINNWKDEEATQFIKKYAPKWSEDLALRVYTSRLIGQNPAYSFLDKDILLIQMLIWSVCGIVDWCCTVEVTLP